jgi:hypothetical protein
MAAVTTFARYPQLGQLAGCRKTIGKSKNIASAKILDILLHMTPVGHHRQ